MVNGESLGFTLLATVVALFIIVQAAAAGVDLIHACGVFIDFDKESNVH